MGYRSGTVSRLTVTSVWVSYSMIPTPVFVSTVTSAVTPSTNASMVTSNTRDSVVTNSTKTVHVVSTWSKAQSAPSEVGVLVNVHSPTLIDTEVTCFVIKPSNESSAIASNKVSSTTEAMMLIEDATVCGTVTTTAMSLVVAVSVALTSPHASVTITRLAVTSVWVSDFVVSASISPDVLVAISVSRSPGPSGMVSVSTVPSSPSPPA